MRQLPTFHDFDLVDVRLGPRREANLELRDGLHGTRCTLRFAAIENFAAVERFFGAVQRPHENAFLARVDGVQTTGDGFTIALDPGGTVRVVTRKPPTVTDGGSE